MADEPSPGSEQEPNENPGRDFAALMSAAAGQANPAAEAPYGYTTDRVTGEQRPKKTPGRPRKSPSIEDLKAARADQDPAGGAGTAEDVAPKAKAGRRSQALPAESGKAAVAPVVVHYTPGVIARGMNRMYRRAGKIIKGFDPVLGEGWIQCATEDPDSDDWVTVGEAWDELARTNPRIRAFLLKMMAGTGWAQVAWSHLPIFMAVVATFQARSAGTHPNQETRKLDDGSVVKVRTFADKLTAAGMNLVADGAAGDEAGSLLDGLTPGDMQQMMTMAQQLMGGMGAKAA